MNNPMQILQMLMQGGINSPQKMAMNLIGKSTGNPMIGNLVQMANKGDTKGVENFARNIFKEKGQDFDKEFANFMQIVRGQNNQNRPINNTKQS